MRSAFYGTIEPSFIAALVDKPPEFVSRGDVHVTPTFTVRSPNGGRFHLKLKNREGKPREGEVYLISMDFVPSRIFETSDGQKHRANGSFLILLSHNRGCQSEGELRWNIFPRRSHVKIIPQAASMRIIDGSEERGILWFALSGVNYNISGSLPDDEILFSGIATVEIPIIGRGDARRTDYENGTRAYRGTGYMIYDHRRYHGSAPARVIHTRRSIDGKSYEFFSVTDISGAEQNSAVPETKLTLNGFVRLAPESSAVAV